MTTGPAFRLEDVTFRVPGRDILSSFTAELPGSGMIGLIGHNGSGKSTLLKILARQQFSTGGNIWFAGRALSEWGSREFSRNVAYLPQQTPLAAGMLVKELVKLGRYPWHGAIGKFSSVDRQKVDEAMALTGVAAFADRFVDSLSGGERQRVWLAMLLSQDAKFLLLDEPTSALDVAHQLDVLALVRKLSSDRGLCVILVLHDVNMAARFCDRIIALHSGRLIANGKPGDLMTPQNLKRIYGLDMSLTVHPTTGQPIALPS